MTDCIHLIYTCYVTHLTPDWIPDLTHTLLCALSILLFIYFIHVISYSSIYYHHMLTVICMCTFPFILTYSLGVLTPYICISRSRAIYCWSGIWRGSHAAWGAGISLFLITGFPALLFMLFLDSLYIVSSPISYSYSYVIMVLDIICIIAVIF